MSVDEPLVSEPAPTGPAEPDPRGDDGPPLPSPERPPPTARGAAALAVTAALASLSTGLAIVAALQTADPTSLTGGWWLSVAFATAALFGPAALAALLGAQGLVRHRPWAPLLLLVVGTLVATAGLVILTLTVSQLSGGEQAPYREFHFIFDQNSNAELALVAVLAALHAVSGTLEAGAGVLGRHATRRPHAIV